MLTGINKPEYFSNLNEIHLKAFARQAVDRFSYIPITKVNLFHYANVFFPDRTVPTKYAMVFTINYDVDLVQFSDFYQIDLSCFSPCEIRAILSYEEFRFACGQRSTLIEDPATFFELTGGRAFSKLYKDGTVPKNYLYEWRFIVKLGNESAAPGVLEDDPYWILFRDDDLHLQSLLTEAGPEVEALFASIKEVGFSAQNLNANDETWQEVALHHFDKNQKHFSLVKREYLEDKDLYAFTLGQEARDFKGGVLQKICEGMGLGKQSAQKLAKLHRQILSNK